MQRIEVLDADRGNRVLADYRGAALDAVTSSITQVPGRLVAPGTMHKAVLDVTRWRPGTVVTAIDGTPDRIPFHAPEPGEPESISGNHVVLDIGGGRYAYFAHLKPGSVRVAVGQRVRAGQQLGKVGNSGNSDLPHVHFQIMDAPSPLASDGLPFVFRSFDSPGSIPPLEQIDIAGVIPVGPALRGHHELVSPMILQVIDYPAA